MMEKSLDRFPEEAIDSDFVVANCEWCGGEIYVCNDVWRIDDEGGFVHDGVTSNCAEGYAFERIYDARGTITKIGGVE